MSKGHGDEASDNLNMPAAECRQRPCRRRVRFRERDLGGGWASGVVLLETQRAYVAQVAHDGEEPTMRTGCALPRVVEVALWFTALVIPQVQGHVEQLQQRALAVAPARQLKPLALAMALVVEDASGQAGPGDALASGVKGADLVAECHGVALVCHAPQERRHVSQSLC